MPSITTHNLVIDGNTATIWLDTAPDSEGHINWSLSLATPKAEVSTSSQVKIPTSNVTENTIDTSKHCKWLKEKLDMIDSLRTKEEKIPVALDILNYISTEGLEFTKHYHRFKAAVTKKCYEFKLGHPDIPCIIDASNNLLLTLGEPLTVPDALIKNLTCVTCGKLHLTGYPINHDDVPAAPAYKPFDSDFALLMLIAKRLKCDRILNNPDIYFKQFTNAISRGFGLGVTKAEKMEMYVAGCKREKKSDEEDRIDTMRRVFIKNNLIFTQDVMALYYEWLPTYRLFLGRANRYEKMTTFAEKHKELFSIQ